MTTPEKTELERAAEAAGQPPENDNGGNAPETSLAEAAAVATGVDKDKLRAEIEEVLQSIYDPEIPVNIYELGLIYGVTIDDGGKVDIEMTLTAPGCPVAGPLVQEVEWKVSQIPGVSVCHAELTFDPPWDMERMSEAAKLQLGMM